MAPSFVHRPPIAGFLASVLMTGLLAGCSKPQPTPEPIRAVKVMTVGPSPVTGAQEYAGEVRARTESKLGFRVGGKLTARLVGEGDRVRAGQVLARIDVQDLRLGVDAARAQRDAARTQRDLTAADLQRYRALREQNFISAAELQRRETAFAAAQSSFAQAQAQLAVQENQAGYAQLVADAPGVVTAVEAEVGQVVSSGTPVLRVAHDGPRDAVFAVPEDQLQTLRRGLAMEVRRWPAGQVYRGEIRELAASADPATRTYAVKVALSGGEPPPLGATVTVVPARPQAAAQAPALAVIKLPTSALRQQGTGTAVWVLDPARMTVHSQPVQVHGADGNELVVVQGLTPGQQVVVAGVHVLTEGQKVTLYRDRLASRAGGSTAAMPAPAASSPSAVR